MFYNNNYCYIITKNKVEVYNHYSYNKIIKRSSNLITEAE